jgi:hypothetical protein
MQISQPDSLTSPGLLYLIASDAENELAGCNELHEIQPAELDLHRDGGTNAKKSSPPGGTILAQGVRGCYETTCAIDAVEQSAATVIQSAAKRRLRS